MAISITPGWDWGPTDRPTRDQLRQSALGLTITGIPKGQLNIALLTASINDATASSNLPGDGSMWIDARGNLWGRNRFGNVRIRSYNGGLETNRIASLGDAGGGLGLPGQVCRISVLTANATNVTESRFLVDTSNGFDLSQMQPAVVQQTAASSASTFYRHTILGYCRLYTPDFGPGFTKKRGRLYQKGVFSNFFTMEDHDVPNSVGAAAQAETVAYDPEGTDSFVAGWFFGLPVRKA